MSYWSYATGWIECMPFGRTQEEKEYILKTVLNHLPIVRGSEEHMYVHIIQAGGHNSTSWRDEYGNRSDVNDVRWINGTQIRDNGYYQSREVQGTYFVFVEGQFRDCVFGEACRQFMKWITRFAKRILVNEVHVRINDTPIDMEDLGYLWENPNWCDHLMWREEDLHGKKT